MPDRLDSKRCQQPVRRGDGDAFLFFNWQTKGRWIIYL